MYFANVGMLDNVTKRLATSNMPGILNSTTANGGDIYSYADDHGIPHQTQMSKQVQFDNAINDMLYGPLSNNQRTMNETVDAAVNDRQIRNINNVTSKPINIIENTMPQQLNQTAPMSTIITNEPTKIPEPPKTKAQQINFDEIYSTEKFTAMDVLNSNGGSILIGILIAFIMFIMIQMYVSQKRIELYLSMGCKQTTGLDLSIMNNK